MAIDTAQRLENSIRHQPDRWIVEREAESRKLLRAWDRDTGRLWVRGEKDEWFWFD